MAHKFSRSLVPFAKATDLDSLSIQINWRVDAHGLLNCEFAFHQASGVDFGSIHKPVRQTSLWENTCLEWFLKPKGESKYWEFNVSPNGAWDVFSFDQYRKGMCEEPLIHVGPSLTKNVSENAILFQILWNLSAIGEWFCDNHYELAISCVVVSNETRSKSYWSIKHPSEKPDFHHPDSFTKLS
jgi:hypothetical protein